MSARGVIVIAIILAAAPAGAGIVHSYAYVTATNGYCSGLQNCTNHRCAITALLPREVLDHPPSGDVKDLLAGATEVSDRITDDDVRCSDIVHTWIPASFDSAHRTAVDLSFPYQGFTISKILELLAFVAVILGVWKVRKQMKRTQAKSDDARPESPAS